jgi:hypothetical protein
MIQRVSDPANRNRAERITEFDVEQWRRHYMRSLDLFKRVGMQTAPDIEQGASRYIELRTEWAPRIRALADSMLYPTENIDPASAKEGSSNGVLSFRTSLHTSPHQSFWNKEK